MDQRQHWDSIYGEKPSDAVSWYRPHLERSIAFIERAGLPPDAPIIDVGGGASTLVDDLLDRGYTDLTVLDLSVSAIASAQARLNRRAAKVCWRIGDITSIDLPKARYAFWHDRAVFHFLNDPAARERYVQAARLALRPDGHIVVATFGPSGPETCSGLSVMRYDAEGIHRQFGDEFRKVDECREAHRTPWGSEQEFVYCYCRVPNRSG